MVTKSQQRYTEGRVKHRLAIEIADDLQYRVRKSEIATSEKEAERKGSAKQQRKKEHTD
jgi:hypothetical protein